jgi:tetratricopeptide (TPR) repeat protein
LLPLFFLPFTSNVLDFNKQALLVVFVLVSLFAWLLKSLIEEKITLDVSRFNLAPAVLLVVTALSTLFSAYKYGSFWGWPLNISSSFLSTLALVLLYFLIVNLFRRPEDVFGLIFILAVSGLLVALVALPQVLGKFPLPFDFAKSTSFNTIGSVNALAVFLAALIPLAASLIFISRKRLVKVLVWLFVIISLFLLLAVNFQTAWQVLLIESSLILIFGIAKREVFNLSWLFLPMLILAFSLFALMMRSSIIPTISLPIEVSPTLGTSFDIAFKAIKSFKPPASWFFGSGPGTFIYDYSIYKPVDINQTVFWGTRFGSGSSEISDRLATTGILGLLSFLGVIAMAGFLGLRSIIVSEARKENLVWIMLTGVVTSFIGVVIGLFLYPSNLSFMFLFWLLLAFIFSLVGTKPKTFNLEPTQTPEEARKGKTATPWITVGVSFAFIAVLIVSMTVFFVQGQRYFAEVNYVKALNDVQKGDNVSAVNHLVSAIRLTGSTQDNYWRDLAQVYLFRINEEIQNKDLSQQEISTNVTNLISSLVTAAKSSSDASPKNVANWTVRGLVYSNIMALITGADNWAITAFEEAIKLEPTNPYIYTALGQVYVSQADSFAQDKTKAAERQKALDTAGEKFQKAVDLKSDYAPARFQLAMIDIRENKIKDAIAKLEETKLIAPSDTGLAFQLGVTYQADDQLDKAKAEFERAVVLDPNYSNARYFLGLLYDEANEKQKAIEQFEKIVQLNPDNEQVKKILENLRAGKKALEGVVQAEQPPIQEKLPEELELTPSPIPSPSPSPSPKAKK